MTRIVVDTSIIGSLMLEDERTERSPAAAAVLEKSELIAPAHWLIETANMFTVTMRRNRISETDRDLMIAAAAAFPIGIEPKPFHAIADRVIALGDRYQLSVYDAAYLELAMRRQAILASDDKALGEAARQAGVDLLTTRA